MKVFGLLIALALIASGCVGGGGESTGNQAQDGAKEFRMMIGHFSYSPSTLTVNQGDTVRILAVADEGTLEHNHGITINEFDVNRAVTSEDPENPTVIEFVANQKGTFKIYCMTCWDGPYGRNHPAIEGTLEVV